VERQDATSTSGSVGVADSGDDRDAAALVTDSFISTTHHKRSLPHFCSHDT
jgi:hypothetical protein